MSLPCLSSEVIFSSDDTVVVFYGALKPAYIYNSTYTVRVKSPIVTVSDSKSCLSSQAIVSLDIHHNLSFVLVMMHSA